MIALEVSHNSDYRLTAGLRLLGILHSFVELDRGTPKYYLQGWESPDELVVWSTPEIEVGDELKVKITKTDQAPTEPSFRGTRSLAQEQSGAGAFYDIVAKYYHALANPSEYLTSTLADGTSATKALEVYQNGQYVLTAGIPGNAGYLDWYVEIHAGLLNHFVKGIDCRTSEHVDWSTPRRRVGDELAVRIIETEQISTASRRFGTERWEKFAQKRPVQGGGSLG
jgi:hypothetical protein